MKIDLTKLPEGAVVFTPAPMTPALRALRLKKIMRVVESDEGKYGLAKHEVRRAIGVSARVLDELLDDLKNAGSVIIVGGVVYDIPTWARMRPYARAAGQGH